MTALWTSRDAVPATGGTCAKDWQATGVSIDTRTLQKGDLFVALSASRDGHDFVADALKKGASAALVSHIPEGLENAPLLLVPDVLKGLEALGIAARARCDAKVVAITGSVGKTGSKEMLRHALAGQACLHVAEKSYNNHEGVPLTLARMPADTEIAIIEIGMNHPGEIAPLAKMARPHVALITTVAPVHLAAFDNVAQIAVEKAAIFVGLEPNSIAVLNSGIETFPILKEAAKNAGARIVEFGAEGADYWITHCEPGPMITTVAASTKTNPFMFKIGGSGCHLAQNALGVLAVVEALDADLARAAMGLANWSPPEGRGAVYDISLGPGGIDGRFTLINESYNANPASVAAALDVLSRQKGRKIAILGDMLELGDTSLTLHRDIAGLSDISKIDRVHTIGEFMASLHGTLPPEQRGQKARTSAELASTIARHIHPGDVVTVKGSLGMKMALVVDAILNMGEATPLNPNSESN